VMVLADVAATLWSHTKVGLEREKIVAFGLGFLGPVLISCAKFNPPKYAADFHH